MKILVIHNFHRKGSASGDDEVFRNETALLERNGIDVIKYTVQNDDFDKASVIKKIKKAIGMFWSFEYFSDIKRIIHKENPDLVHIHTFFPLLSPSILYAAKRNGVKVIATLHDTRFICPCATSLRGSELCNKCGDGSYFRMCIYGCFKNSRLQSFLIAIIFKYHRWRKSFYKQIDKYICLNDNQVKLLIDTGFDKSKIVKKYNFVEDIELNDIEGHNRLPERYVVFYGRIGEEKGIRLLMRIWNKIDDIPLVVMGSGSLEKEFKTWAIQKENIYFLGYTQHEKCLSIVKNGEFVVFPSICYEGCSMVQIESESLGKALISTDLGFSSEAIINGYNGYKIKLNDITGFVDKIKYLWCNPTLCREMGKNARNDYEIKYRPEENFIQLKRIYKEVLKNI